MTSHSDLPPVNCKAVNYSPLIRRSLPSDYSTHLFIKSCIILSARFCGASEEVSRVFGYWSVVRKFDHCLLLLEGDTKISEVLLMCDAWPVMWAQALPYDCSIGSYTGSRMAVAVQRSMSDLGSTFERGVVPTHFVNHCAMWSPVQNWNFGCFIILPLTCILLSAAGYILLGHAS